MLKELTGALRLMSSQRYLCSSRKGVCRQEHQDEEHAEGTISAVPPCALCPGLAQDAHRTMLYRGVYTPWRAWRMYCWLAQSAALRFASISRAKTQSCALRKPASYQLFQGVVWLRPEAAGRYGRFAHSGNSATYVLPWYSKS